MKRGVAFLATGAAVGVLLSGIPGRVFAQGDFSDVPPSHWAHQAVESLAEAGLILGYPDGHFLGNRTLTRYEMATLVKRLLDYLQANPPQVGTAPSPAPAPTPTTSVTPEQLAQINKLVEEYKAELAVIGTDLKAVQAQLGTLNEDVSGLKELTATQQTALDAINDNLKAHRIDGYIQARYTVRGTSDSKKAPENVPQDTTRGISGNRDTFQVRRARLNIRGDVTDRTGYRFQLDAGGSSGNSSVSVKEAYVTIKNIVPNILGLTGDLYAGQQVTPFGYYLQFSSGSRESPERFIAFSDTGSGLFPDQDYDKGLAFAGKLLRKFDYRVGVFNGNGTRSNDSGRRKDVIGHLGLALAENWDIGISGYDGEGPNTGTTVPIDLSKSDTYVGPAAGLNVAATRRRVKSLFGVDTQYYLPIGNGAAIKAEYVRGKGGLSGASANTVPSAMRAYVDAATVEGYYGLFSYNFSKKLTLATAYEYFNRNADPASSGPFSTFNGQPVSKSNFAEERLHAGFLYYLDTATRFRFWYESPLNYPNLPGGSESVPRVDFYTAEIQVSF